MSPKRLAKILFVIVISPFLFWAFCPSPVRAQGRVEIDHANKKILGSRPVPARGKPKESSRLKDRMLRCGWKPHPFKASPGRGQEWPLLHGQTTAKRSRHPYKNGAARGPNRQGRSGCGGGGSAAF